MPDNDPPHRQQNLSIRSLGREPKSWPQGTAKNAVQPWSRLCHSQGPMCGATLLVNMRDIEPRKEDDGFDGAFLSP